MKNKYLLVLGFLLMLALTGCTRTYQVTYEISEGNTETEIVTEGEAIKDFVPFMQGYQFNYWTLDDEPYDVETPVTTNITLKASWTADDCIVNYYSEGELIQSDTLDSGTIISDILSITRAEYVFLGWQDNLGHTFDFTKPLIGSIDLYANWISNDDYVYDVTVNFNSTGAHQEFESIIVTRLAKFENLPVPVREGYIFLGWYLDEVQVNDDYILDTLEMEVTLIAKWEELDENYDINFDSAGGNVLSTKVVEYGENVELPTPTLDDATFVGWIYDGSVYTDTFDFNVNYDITLLAMWDSDVEDYVVDGNEITYYGSGDNVEIPINYTAKAQEFRGVWVSSYVADFTPSSDEDTMKANLTEMLDNCEKLHLNAIVFHLRAENDAFYKTQLAPIKSSYGTYEDFENWDYLTWFINECHSRDIEFHAWLNPYRLHSKGISSIADAVEEFADYPENPASNADNILLTSSGGAILNPAKAAVQDYIVKVCEELANNYDIDAIHFDDYFYAALDNNDDDQADYEAYITANPSSGYSASSTTDKADWRRDNVSNMISKLHSMLTKHNMTSSRYVQLGISPTGVWQNGNGVVTYDSEGNPITNGSLTGGYAHYGYPLYADTIAWATEGWIDYLLPQCYHGMDWSVAKYQNEVDWWADALKYLDTKLYIGSGIYMAGNRYIGNTNYHSWQTNPYEVSDQILYNSKLDKVEGICFFRYAFLVDDYDNEEQYSHVGVTRIVDEYWATSVVTPSFK